LKGEKEMLEKMQKEMDEQIKVMLKENQESVGEVKRVKEEIREVEGRNQVQRSLLESIKNQM